MYWPLGIKSIHLILSVRSYFILYYLIWSAVILSFLVAFLYSFKASLAFIISNLLFNKTYISFGKGEINTLCYRSRWAKVNIFALVLAGVPPVALPACDVDVESEDDFSDASEHPLHARDLPENNVVVTVKLRKPWTTEKFQECWLCTGQSQ